MSVISNTTTISTFAQIGQLAVLQRIFDTVYISTEVHEEILAGLDEGYTFYEAVTPMLYPLSVDGWIHLVSMASETELQLFSALPSRLHRGEASCLAIAKHRGWTVLTDDRAARAEATRLGVKVSGSVGCLILAVERAVCATAQANQWLHAMIQRGYRSPTTDLTALIKF